MTTSLQESQKETEQTTSASILQFVASFQKTVTEESLHDPNKTSEIQTLIKNLHCLLEEFGTMTEGSKISKQQQQERDALQRLLDWLHDHNGIADDQYDEFVRILPVIPP